MARHETPRRAAEQRCGLSLTGMFRQGVYGGSFYDTGGTCQAGGGWVGLRYHQERPVGDNGPGNLAQRTQRCLGQGRKSRSDGQTRKGLNKVFSQVNAKVARKGGRGIRWAEGPFLVCEFASTHQPGTA